MLDKVELAASDVGINAFLTNSNEKIEAQLNRLTREEDLPIMLVSWDLDVTLTFDANGFLNNPSVVAVILLVDKAEDKTKKEAEITANAMGDLFQSFVQKLHKRLIPVQKRAVSSLSNVGYKLVPKHGMGAHSGILGRFTMATAITACT